MARGTGVGPEGRDLLAQCGEAGPVPEEATREVSAFAHSVRVGSTGADGDNVGVVADLRGRSRPGTIRLSTGPERGRRRQAHAPAAESGPPRRGGRRPDGLRRPDPPTELIKSVDRRISDGRVLSWIKTWLEM